MGDYFRFRVSALNVNEERDYEFHIKLIGVEVKLIRSAGLLLSGLREAAISSDELKASSSVA